MSSIQPTFGKLVSNVTNPINTTTTTATSTGIGSTASTLSSAATSTAATKAKPGFFGAISAFVCGIIDSVCKAFEKCFASIKGLFVRTPAATTTTVASTVASTVAPSAEKVALTDLKAMLDTDATKVINQDVINYYTSRLKTAEFGDKLLEAVKGKMYELAFAAKDDLKVSGGFVADWAGEAIKLDPRNAYAKKAVEALIAAAK